MKHQLNNTPSSRSRQTRRRGAIAVWGLVCLMLATAVTATLGRLALTGTRLVLQEHRRSQCEWMLQSGWSLAVSRLRENPSYTGETWDVAADQLGGSDLGQVVIEVTAADTGATNAARLVRIVARYPLKSTRLVQLTKTGSWPQPAERK